MACAGEVHERDAARIELETIKQALPFVLRSDEIDLREVERKAGLKPN